MASDIASIGIAIDTAGLEKGAVALDALAKKGDAVDKAMSQVEGAAARAKKSLDTLGQSAKGQSGLEQVGAGAQSAAKGMEAVGGAADKVKERIAGVVGSLFSWGDAAKKAAIDQERLIKIIDTGSFTNTERNHIKALADKANQLRMTGEEYERYVMKSKGMSEAAQEVGGALRKTIEELKNAESASKSTSLAMGLIEKAAKAAAGVFAGFKIADFIKDSIMLAARFETMGVVMGVAGNNAGYTRKEMEGFAASLQKSGISMMESRNVLTQLATAHIDLSKAAALGRAAQDLAVVGGINSSEALNRMVHGIKSGQVEILRTMGLNVNFEQSYKDLARTLGKNSEALTEQEKTLARTNATLQAAKGYVGIYEESMTTAGKAIGSLTRYWEDLKIKVGETFLKSAATSIFALTDALKDANSEMDALGKKGSISTISNSLNTVLTAAFRAAAIAGSGLATTLSVVGNSVGALLAQLAALGRGDFKGAAVIEDERMKFAADSWASFGDFVDKVMGNTTASMNQQAGVAKQTADAVGEQAEAAKGAASATEQQRIEAGKLNQIQTAGADAAARLFDSAQKSLTIEQQRVKELQKLRAEYEAVSVAGARTPEQLTQDTQNYLQARRSIEASNQPSLNRDQLLDAIARVESGGQQFYQSGPKKGQLVTSEVGAMGMYQIMPQSGPHLAQLAGVQWSKERLQQDADYGRTLAGAYIEYLMRIFDGDAVKALTAYHSGQGNVGKAIAKAGIGGDWLQYLGPNGQKYANLVLGQFTKDAKGNFSGLRDGAGINKEAIAEQSKIREMQDATRASTAALEAAQQGYNKTMADFIGLKATDNWKTFSEEKKKAYESDAIAKSNIAALTASHQALEAATQSAASAWDEYNATINKTAGYTSEMAAEQARYQKEMEGASKNALSQATLEKLQQEHLQTMVQLREKDAASQASALAKQADQLEESNKYYGQSAISIGEMRKARVQDALAVEIQSNGYTELAKKLESLASQQGRVNEAMKQAEYKKLMDELKERVRAGEEQLAVEQQSFALAGLTGVERAKATIELERQLRLKKDIAEIDKKGLTGEQRENAIAEATRAGIVEAQAKAAKAVNDDWQKTSDSINQSLTDALLRGFESGKDFAKNFRDTLVNMFKTLVLRPIIQATLAPVAGGMAALMGGNASAGQGGIGQASNALSMGSILRGGVGAFGTSASWGLTNVLAGNIGSTFGGAMSMLGAGQIGSGLGALAGAAATALLPLLALVGSGAFSRKHEQHNLQGTFGGASGFEGTWHDYYRGGLLRSSKTEDTPIDTKTLKGLREAWKAQEEAVTSYARTLGLATDKISGFTYNINLKLKDLGDPNAKGYAAKVMERVNEAIAAGSDALAQQILGTWTETTETVKKVIWQLIGGDEGWANVTTEETVTRSSYAQSQYTREGEKAIETLTRLAVSLDAANNGLDTLELKLYEGSLAGGDLASKLMDQFGGAKWFSQASENYWQTYYREDERIATLKRQFTIRMEELGLGQEIPTTRDEFRGLVKKQDLNDEAGRKVFAELLNIAPMFAQITKEAESSTDLMQRQKDLLAEQAKLQIDLMAARGDATGAAAARRTLETEGYSDADRAIYDANQALRDQIDLEKQRLDLLRQQQTIQADLLEASGDVAGAQALRRELATVGFSEAALAIYDANQALRDQIAAIQKFTSVVSGIGSSLVGVIQDGLLGNLSAADLGGRMADVVIGGVYNAMASGFSQQITSMLMNGLVTPMVQAALVGASVTEAVSRAAIDQMLAQATAVAQAMGAVMSDPAFRAAMTQVQGIMEGLAASIAPAQAYYVNYDTRQQEAQRAAQEAQRLADQQAQEAQRLAQQAAQEAQRAADEEARRQQAITNERLGLTKQLLQLEGNTTLLRQMELETLDPSNRALQQRIWAIEDETAAAEKYKSALKDAQDFLGGFTKNIEEFIFKVSHAQADAQQSYQMAAAKFTAQMTLARGGDRDAMNGITGYADTLIGSIRRESTTGAEANLRIARVLGQLASLPKQVSAEQLIVDAIVNANTSLETVLSTNFASLDANVDGLLTAGELAASGLATNTQISALMARVDANGDGMISKQELANSRLQTLATAQGTTNTNLGNVTSAQNSTNSWLSQIQMADVGYSLSNVNAINAGAGATVAAINKTNASLGAALVRDYNQAPVVAQFSSDSPLFSIFAAINETNAWLYHIHGLETASIRFWEAMLNNSAPVTVRSENRTPANGTVFSDGGYTGPGAKWEPAGVVHKGEVVWSQADVARWGGPGIVDALRQGAPGYADGGPVAVRVPQIYVPPVGRSNEETQALLREVLAELRAQRSDDRARHNSLAEPLQRMDRRGAKWDRDGLPAERTNEAIA